VSFGSGIFFYWARFKTNYLHSNSMTYNNIEVRDQDGIRVITVNRPNYLNALNRETIEELGKVLDETKTNDAIRCLIVTGSGEKAFVAGADIKEFAGFDVREGQALSANGQKVLFDKLEKLRKPSIAAVNGFALGGGLELAMSCHMRVASDNARLGLPEVTLGVIPGYGGTQRLAHLVGKGKAIEMITTGGMVKADDAYKWGLVNHVTSQEELMDYCLKLASKIAANSPMAINSAIKAVLAGYRKDENGFHTETQEFGACFGTDDFKEGTSAFLEKRKPDFKGS
jgi:enoyl-CoA hydratase